jgi:YidC/Oxa1 family membrane protein insertase
MDRKIALAVGLMLLVAVVPSLLFPPERPAPPQESAATVDSGIPPTVSELQADSEPAEFETAPVAQAIPEPPAAVAESVVAGSVDERLVVVESELYRYVFSSRGARLVSATLKSYDTFASGESGPAQLIPENSRFFTYDLVFGRDTVSLADWHFEPSRERLDITTQSGELEWIATRNSAAIRIRQTFSPEEYWFDVDAEFSGIVMDAGLVLVNLGPRLRLVEADSVWDFRMYATVVKDRSPERTNFSSLDPGERAVLAGPFEWVAMKSRYFTAVVLTVEDGEPRIGGAVMTGRMPTGRHETEADLAISLPAPGGRFGHSVYLGPQQFRRLSRIGYDLEDMNPYGWFLKPVIQPIAKIVALILVWMHETFNLAYGWVLVLFGLAVRVVLWPLNQKAMRSSMAMQAIQPEIKAVQEKHKQDPQKLQQEMMKLYKEHQVNPLGGCLPMLIPMPVLFALFFVFRETIEFRGVPFLWLPDLSRADPFYIVPIVMGLSMFGVSKLGQLGIPPTPQTKMMVYFMPVMFTVLFMKFSSGLNLYYAVSNIASIPQQWMIARERLARAGKVPKKKPKPDP